MSIFRTCIVLFITFTKIGFLSFGGLTMVPLIAEEAGKYGWLTEKQLMDLVAIAEMTPGSLGVNCATFCGLKAAGIVGSIFATLGAMMPSLTLCLGAAIFMKAMKDNKILNRTLKGLRPVSIALLLATMVSLCPDLYWNQQGINVFCIAVGVLSLYLLVIRKLSIPEVVALGAILGIIIL